MHSKKILGLMSGSSLDGLDIALVEFNRLNSKNSFILLEANTIAYPESLQRRLANAPLMSAKDMMLLEIDYTKAMSQIVQRWLRNSPFEIDYIASHGHTIFHFPKEGLTKQIGNGGVLAAHTKIPVICDFRNGDIALKGQGAPMAPIADRDLFPGHSMYLNMGGISNISIFKKNSIQAYDISPCNQLLNYLSQQKGKPYDLNGKWASRGKLNEALYHALGSNPFYKLKPPKSLDNQWIRENVFIVLDAFSIKLEDKMNTCVHFIVDHIIGEIQQFKNLKGKTLFVTGGGANNTFMIKMLKEKLDIFGIELILPLKEIIDFKEAILIAYAGFLRVLKENNMISQVTGAKRDSIGGCIYLS